MPRGVDISSLGWGHEVTLNLRPCYNTGSHGLFYKATLKMALTLTCFLSQTDLQKDKIDLVPIYLGFLYYKLDECVGNIMKLVGCFHVVTHVDTTFIQLFLWERFKRLGPNQRYTMT